MNTVSQDPTPRTPSTSLRERVRGQQAPRPLPPTLREAGRQIDPAYLQTIATVVEAVVGKHWDELAQRTGQLVAADQPQARAAIEAAIDTAIRRAWDTNKHTEPRRRDRPERNAFDSPAAERAS